MNPVSEVLAIFGQMVLRIYQPWHEPSIEGNVERHHSFVQKVMAWPGTTIDAFNYCPRHPDFSSNCTYHKPAPGMLVHASLELNLDLVRSWMIGDKLIDVHAGHAAGV